MDEQIKERSEVVECSMLQYIQNKMSQMVGNVC